MMQICQEGWIGRYDVLTGCNSPLSKAIVMVSVVVTTWAEAHLVDLGHHAWSAELLIATPWSLCANCGMDCYGHWISALLWSGYCGHWLCFGLRGLCLSHCPDLSLSMCAHIQVMFELKTEHSDSRPTEPQIQSSEVKRIQTIWIHLDMIPIGFLSQL